MGRHIVEDASTSPNHTPDRLYEYGFVQYELAITGFFRHSVRSTSVLSHIIGRVPGKAINRKVCNN